MVQLYTICNQKSRCLQALYTHTTASIIERMKSASSHNYIIFGLGNPGKEYEHTRHNAGRNAVLRFVKDNDLPSFEKNKKLEALASEGAIENTKIQAVLPETFMNKSGITAKSLKLKNKKQMGKISPDDTNLLKKGIKKAASALQTIIQSGVERAMNEWN